MFLKCKYLTKHVCPPLIGVIIATSSCLLSAGSLDDCQSHEYDETWGILQVIKNSFMQKQQCTEESLKELGAKRADENYLLREVGDGEYRLVYREPSFLSEEQTNTLAKQESVDRYSVETERPDSAEFDIPTAAGYRTLGK